MAVPAASVTWQRMLIALGTFVLVILVLACLYWARAVLIPVSLAIMLTFLLGPIVNRLQRVGLKRVPSVILVVTLMTFLVVGIGWLVSVQVVALADELPAYQQNVTRKIADLRGAGKDSFLDKVQSFLQQVTREIHKEEQFLDGREKPQPVQIVPDDGSTAFAPYLAVVTPLLEPLGSAGLVIVLLVFTLMNKEDLRNRFIRLVGHGHVTVTTKALDDASQRISRFLMAQLIVNGTFGLAIGVGLFFIGVPHALLWGFLAFVLRYIPYIGNLIAAMFPVALSLLVFDNWTQPLMVIGLHVVLELLSNMVMEPLMFGQSIGVSEAALLVAVAFWTWIWGPMGLVLSTQLTVCLVVLGKYVPYLKFFDVLLGDEPALDTDIGYYQRLLARDQDEAADIAKEQARHLPLEQVCDEMLVPALTYARRDLDNDRLTEDEARFIVRATDEIVEELVLVGSPSTPDEAGSAVDDSPRVPILLCPARDETDEVALAMFRQVLDPVICAVETTSSHPLTSEVVALVEEKRPAIVCITSLPPGGLAHTRLLCMRLRARFPDLKIVVGRWGLKSNFEKNRDQLTAAGADLVGASVAESKTQVRQVVQILRHQEAPTSASVRAHKAASVLQPV